MNLTSKSRYALKVMVDLALHLDQPKQQRQDIVKRQGIPADYIDQILARLRKADLVESIRGRNGGFTLKKSPEDITAWDIFQAAEDSIYSVQCLDNSGLCHFDESCPTKTIWTDIYDNISSGLSKKSLAYMATIWKDNASGEEEAPPITKECKGPSKRVGNQSVIR